MKQWFREICSELQCIIGYKEEGRPTTEVVGNTPAEKYLLDIDDQKFEIADNRSKATIYIYRGIKTLGCISYSYKDDLWIFMPTNNDTNIFADELNQIALKIRELNNDSTSHKNTDRNI